MIYIIFSMMMISRSVRNLVALFTAFFIFIFILLYYCLFLGSI